MELNARIVAFSTPRVGLVDIGSGPQPVVMFAGGYDVNKDKRGVVGSNDSEGNAIYIVDAKTGALIWKARGGSSGATGKVFEHPQLVDSIPSTLAAGDTDGDGLTDRLVVGGRTDDLSAGLELAADSIDSGAAADTLERFVAASQGGS